MPIQLKTLALLVAFIAQQWLGSQAADCGYNSLIACDGAGKWDAKEISQFKSFSSPSITGSGQLSHDLTCSDQGAPGFWTATNGAGYTVDIYGRRLPQGNGWIVCAAYRVAKPCQCVTG